MPDHPVACSDGNFRKLQVGDLQVFALSDGYLDVPLANFPSAETPRAARLLHLGADDPLQVRIPVNCFLLHARDNIILFDTGCGSALASTAGKLPENLAAAGYGPGQVNMVVMTHLHIDHAGGLTRDDEAVFPNAELVVSGPELDYWSNPRFPDSAPPRQKSSAVIAARVLDICRARIRKLHPREALSPEIASLPLPGHTPGHTGFVLRAGDDRLFIWGDIIHSCLLQFAEPDWHYAGDVDRDEAAATRLETFSGAASGNSLIAGMHLPFPGVGMVERDGAAFRFVARDGRSCGEGLA